MIDLTNIVDLLGILGGLVYALETAVYVYLEYRKKTKEEKIKNQKDMQ